VVRTDLTAHPVRVDLSETPDLVVNQAIQVHRVLPDSLESKVLVVETERWASEVLPEFRDLPDTLDRPEHQEMWDLMDSWVLREFKEIPDSRVCPVTPALSAYRDRQAV